MPKAWLVTHPETAMDRQGRVHGNLDPPLSGAGKVKAQTIARSMKSKGIKRILCSPRQRAEQTAHIIGKETGAPVTVCSELIPWDLANMSGAKTASIRPLLDFFSARPDRTVPGGESKSAVIDRYKRFSKQLKPGDVIVGHSQHSLAWEHISKGGDAAKVPMFGGKAGEIKEISL